MLNPNPKFKNKKIKRNENRNENRLSLPSSILILRKIKEQILGDQNVSS